MNHNQIPCLSPNRRGASEGMMTTPDPLAGVTLAHFCLARPEDCDAEDATIPCPKHLAQVAAVRAYYRERRPTENPAMTPDEIARERATEYTLRIDADEYGQRRLTALCRDETTTLAYTAHMEEVRQVIAQVLDDEREARARIGAALEWERHLTALAAAEVFSNEVDGLSVLEQVEFADKIERARAVLADADGAHRTHD